MAKRTTAKITTPKPSRHSEAVELIDPDIVKRSSFVLDARHEPTAGHMHAHRKAQLLHAVEGVIHVTTENGYWIVPPHRAVWVPPRVKHCVSSRRAFRLMTLYSTAAHASLADTCRVVAVDRLLEELLKEASTYSVHAVSDQQARLLAVIVDRLPMLAVSPFMHLPSGQSREIQRVTQALLAEPELTRGLDGWARLVGLGGKTFARRFLVETGTSFGQWRKHCRVLRAIQLLAEGESVTRAAFEVGYQDVSAFIAAFRAITGVTPARFL
jgi:AraC-like DNA-binding protein/mannose-6-phosphate isomerase-like protein (cupin superfamily)